jgi:hypothetical protein
MKNNNLWKRIEEEFLKYPEDFGTSASEHLVNKAEDKLNLSFSDGYKNFVLKYGSGILPGHIIYGLIPLDVMGTICTNVMDKTNFYKLTQKWPDIGDWYVISDDGSGNPIGCKPDGSIWLSDHDAGFEQVKLADNFEEFLEKLLNDTLYE